MSPAAHTPRYWAFISYSSPDEAVARRLHKRLETYRVPRDLVGRQGRDEAVPRRIFPVFRDRDELPLSADLGSAIEEALRRSRYLIVLCSRRSAASRWVNEEVRAFKAMGREDRVLAVIIDGEPNASDSDDPERRHDECFPPALRHVVDAEGRMTSDRIEPAGGDLRSDGDGWDNVRLKVVAGITGLSFEAFARREHKRARQRRMIAAIAAMVALVAGLWAWDCNRLKVSHYANLGTHLGVPVGVGPLDSRDRAGRAEHYEFHSRRRRVRRVLHVDSGGVLREDDAHDGGADHRVFYREDGTVQQVDRRDRLGQLLVRREFSELRPTDHGAVHFIELKQEHRDAPLAQPADFGIASSTSAGNRRSDITALEVTYDATGREIAVKYLNGFRENRANANGVFGHRLTYDGDDRLPDQVTSVDATGAPIRIGVATVRTVRAESGDVLEERFAGPSGQPVTNAKHVALVVKERDAFGNVTQESYFGIGGEAVLHADGFHRLVVRYDDLGREVENAFFDVEGRPRTRRGFHKLTADYDERGNRIRVAFFDSEGQPTVIDGKYHQEETRYDERGNPIERAVFGTDGSPALKGRQFKHHREVTAFDEAGRMIEWATFGVDGEPVWNDNGYHRVTQEFDERGNLIAYATFDSEGDPARPTGVCEYRRVFDVRGNVIEQSYFGPDGRPMLLNSEYHVVRYTFDDRGNETSRSYFGKDGEPVLPNVLAQYHRREVEFDEHGNSEAFFGVRGEPIEMGRWGYHRTTRVFDERGQTIEEAFFDTYGNPTLAVRSMGKCAEVFDHSGQVIREPPGYFREGDAIWSGWLRPSRPVFDERGQPLQIVCFDERGRPIAWRRGGHRSLYAWDDRGHPTERRLLDTNSVLICIEAFTVDDHGRDQVTQRTDIVPDLHTRVVRMAQGSEIEHAYFDPIGEPTVGPFGYHRYQRTLDRILDDGKREDEVAYFGPNGEPALGREGFHRFVQRYDGPAFSPSVEAYFGVDGRPAAGPEGWQEHRIEKHGAEQVRSYFDVHQRPALGPDGWHRRTMRSGDGHEEEAYFGVDGKAALGRTAQVKTLSVGAHGVLSGGWMYRDCPDGYHRRTVSLESHPEHFADTRMIEQAFWGPDGAPIRGPDGWHKLVVSYDDAASAGESERERSLVGVTTIQTTALALFDVDDSPAVGPEGWHKWIHTSRPDERRIESAFFGVNGRPASGPSGWHRKEWQRDDRGVVVSSRAFDEQGEPLTEVTDALSD